MSLLWKIVVFASWRDLLVLQNASMASLTVILRPASEGDWRSGSALICIGRALDSVISPAGGLSRSANELAGGQNADRIQFQRVMKDAGRHKFDVLLFWSLERLTREGTFKTLCYLRQLTDAGVKYKSYTEQYIDSLGVFGDAIVGIIGAIAAQERLRISERTKARLARAPAQRTQLGRPRGGREINVARARKLRAEGLSITAIARKMKPSRAMVCARLNATGNHVA